LVAGGAAAGTGAGGTGLQERREARGQLDALERRARSLRPRGWPHDLHAPALDPAPPALPRRDDGRDAHPRHAHATAHDREAIDLQGRAPVTAGLAGCERLLLEAALDGVGCGGRRPDDEAISLEAAAVGHDEAVTGMRGARQETQRKTRRSAQNASRCCERAHPIPPDADSISLRPVSVPTRASLWRDGAAHRFRTQFFAPETFTSAAKMRRHPPCNVWRHK
jgi:hypothetical protein